MNLPQTIWAEGLAVDVEVVKGMVLLSHPVASPGVNLVRLVIRVFVSDYADEAELLEGCKKVANEIAVAHAEFSKVEFSQEAYDATAAELRGQ